MTSNELLKKISSLRKKIKQSNIKKSGYNKYKNFKYFDTKDFLPIVDDLCNELNILCTTDFKNKKLPKLYIYNLDKENDKYIFYINTSDVKKENIQDVGSYQTYCIRYLYIQLLNLVESDYVDKNLGCNEEKKTKPKITQKQ